MNQIPNIEKKIKDIFKELHNSIELSLGNKQSIKWALEQKQEDVIDLIHQQLQKAREEERVQIANALVDALPTGTIDAFEIIKAVKKFQESLSDHSELDQDKTTSK